MNKYLHANRIEFAITYLCNSKCRHCQLGELEQRTRFPNHVDKKLAVQIVRKVGRKYHPKSVMTFGGEPLLYPEIVCAIHAEAKKVGIPIRDVITNGFWSEKKDDVTRIARKLARSGVTEVALSVDGFHQESVPTNIARMAAQALLEAGVPDVHWNPCWLVARHHDNAYNRKTEAVLDELKDLPVKVGEGNTVQPEGRAVVWLKSFLPDKTKMPKGMCGEMPYTEKLDSVSTICAEPDGRISVCKELHIGNALQTDIIDLIEGYDPFKIPEARALVKEGIVGLEKWARSRGVKPNPEGYYNICDMCLDIRRRVKLLDAFPDQSS